MSCRPDNFDADKIAWQIAKPIDGNNEEHQHIRDVRSVEAGADAMLEALSKKVGKQAIWFGRTDSGDLLIYVGVSPNEEK